MALDGISHVREGGNEINEPGSLPILEATTLTHMARLPDKSAPTERASTHEI